MFPTAYTTRRLKLQSDRRFPHLLILMVDIVMARPYYSGMEAPVGKYNRIDSMQPRTKSFPSFAILLLSVASSDFLSGNPVFWPAFSGTQDSTNNINP